jgi:indolepyruvate ferredoxin oxidoreductase beta subunit
MIACGVGGQGVVMMCNIVGKASAELGRNAISGEMHGLAQRNGSVFIHQRLGPGILSPLVPDGEADVVLSLEIMEGVRHLHFLKPGGTVLSNTRLIHPPGESQFLVSKKIEKYVTHEEVVGAYEEAGARLIQVDALGLANEAGNPLTENVVMVGALTALPEFPLGSDVVLEALKAIVPPTKVDVNIKAFESGRAVCTDACR